MSATETKGTALITGASAGMSAIYADRLDKAEWDAFDAARRAMSRLSSAVPAHRYNTKHPQSAGA